MSNIIAKNLRAQKVPTYHHALERSNIVWIDRSCQLHISAMTLYWRHASFTVFSKKFIL
jgi:hypothetical protein